MNYETMGINERLSTNLADSMANNESFAVRILKIVCIQLRNRALKHGPFEIHGIRVDAAKDY